MRWGPLVLFVVGILRALPAFAAQVTVVLDEKSSKGAVMLSRGQRLCADNWSHHGQHW